MPGSSLHNEWFLKHLTDIVDANMGVEHFGASQLAEKAGKSRSHIHRYLKDHNKESISQFICRLRLEKALELLNENSLTVSEIAYDVGFSSPSYFIKCFHQKYGYSPGEVKKRFNEQNAEAEPVTGKEKVSHPKKRGPSRGRVLKRSVVVVLFMVLMATLWYYLPGREDSIIVLPFENFSNNPEIEYFAQGIQEDILNDLYHISDLRIVSRTSAEQFRDGKLSISQITRRMRVKYALEGSVRWSDGYIRISTQLIKVRLFREDHIWSQKFDKKLENFIGVQDEIALLVASSIKKQLSQAEIDQIRKLSTQSSKAYDHYMNARFLHHKATNDMRSGFDHNGAIQSIKHYEMAIAEDPYFAEAYAGLANASFQLTAWKIIPGGGGFVRARELCLKAIEIDPDCAEAHCILGAFYVWGQRKFEAGKAELQTAMQLNPNFATTRQMYAQLLQITGPIEQAREHVNHALVMEPNFWVVLNLNSWIYYFEEKYQDALKACTHAHDFNPDFIANQWLHVLNYNKLGQGDKMKQQLQKMAKQYSDSDKYTAEIQTAYDRSGIDGLLLWMIQTNKNNPINVEGLNGHPYYIAWWYTLLGEKEEALFWLEKVPEEKRIPWHYFNLIATNPDFDFLRNEPRFLLIIDKIGLTPYHSRAKES